MYYIHDKSIYPCGKCGSPGVVIAHDLSTREGIDIGIGDVVCSNRKCKMHFGRNLPASTHYSGKYRTTKKAAIAIWNMINTDIRDMYPQMNMYDIVEETKTDPDEVPDHHDAFDAMFPGCTPDDLPFPEVEGGDE